MFGQMEPFYVLWNMGASCNCKMQFEGKLQQFWAVLRKSPTPRFRSPIGRVAFGCFLFTHRSRLWRFVFPYPSVAPLDFFCSPTRRLWILFLHPSVAPCAVFFHHPPIVFFRHSFIRSRNDSFSASSTHTRTRARGRETSRARVKPARVIPRAHARARRMRDDAVDVE